jgi:hypothetical protein
MGADLVEYPESPPTLNRMDAEWGWFCLLAHPQTI